MAIPGYMWLLDDQGNQIKSNSKVSGREGACEVIGFQHRVYIPNDSDTGALMGTRKHEPFVITKAFCPATPELNKACCSGKTLQQVKLSWYRINDQGQEEEYFRHTLNNVKVVAVQPIMDDIKDKRKETYGHLESVALRYEEIRWEYLDGNIAANDKWSERS